MTSSALAPPGVARSRLKARITGSSSPFSVLPAMSTGRSGDTRKKRSTRSRAASRQRARSSASNFRLPVIVIRAGSAPSADQAARRLFPLHAEAIDVGQHAAEEGRISR